jgi:hypothetical protein
MRWVWFGFVWDTSAGKREVVDPCGENGEFHSFAWAGPMFSGEIRVKAGEWVERDGFVYAELKGSWQSSFIHPTLRKEREGWGHPSIIGWDKKGGAPGAKDEFFRVWITREGVMSSYWSGAWLRRRGNSNGKAS